MGNTITVRKYVRGTFVETYEQTVKLPDNITIAELEDQVDLDDGEELVSWLEDNGLLEDWGDYIHFDDNQDDVEFGVESVILD